MGKRSLKGEEIREEKKFLFKAPMLPAQNRLKKDKDFRRVCRQGKPVFFENLALRSLANNLSYIRIGISVSKKIFKKATQRNRVKRILREALRQYLGFLKPGFDVMVFVKGSQDFVGAGNFSKIKENIREILKKGNLFN